MYKIIGGDGQQYGPVTAEQLRQWAKEGRVTAATQVLADGATEWKPLGSMPEFAGLFGAPSPVAPPSTTTVNADALTATLLARDYEVKIGDWISRGWELVKSDLWVFVGATFVGQLIASMSIIGLILGGPMMGGLFAMYLKKSRGQSVTFGDAFAGFSMFMPLMLAYIVSGLLTGVGVLLCIIPGIYLGVCWMFTLPLVIDKKMEFWPAMGLSRKMVNKHWWGIFGFLIVCCLINLGGILLCCVGAFFTAAIVFAALTLAYEDIFGSKAS